MFTHEVGEPIINWGLHGHVTQEEELLVKNDDIQKLMKQSFSGFFHSCLAQSLSIKRKASAIVVRRGFAKIPLSSEFRSFALEM